MRKRIAFVAIFLVAFTLLFMRFSKVFTIKYDDGTYNMERFYDIPKNTVDVMFFGTSHAYMGYNPITLWEEAGITSCILGGGNSPIWNSYYFLEEALKYQSPQVVIIDSYGTVFDFFEANTAIASKNTFGFKPSLNKYIAKKESFAAPDYDNYAFDFISDHNRYAYLNTEDFLEYKGNPGEYKNCLGFFTMMNKFGFDEHFGPAGDRCGEMTTKAEYYLRKMIELCQSKDIKVIVAVAPYFPYVERENAIYNTINNIANEYNVPFYNFNTMADLPLSTYEDFSDPAHLNFNGSKKLTHLFVDILEDYELPNHLEDSSSKYDKWRDLTAYYTRYDMASVLNQFDGMNFYGQYIGMLPEGFLVIFNQKGDTYDSEAVRSFFNTVGINIKHSEDDYWIYDTTTRETTKLTQTPAGYLFSDKYLCNELTVTNDGIYINGTNVQKHPEKNNIVVFDAEYGKLIDSIYFEEERIIR